MVNKLQIVRVDSVTVRKVDLLIGYNIIGRGAATGHVDNQIVEEAVTIHLAPNGEMTMTPMLACYMKSSCSSRWKSLKVGREVPVHPGDICSLLPDKSWFKITSTDCSAMQEDNDAGGKRKAANPTDEEPPDKKPRSANSVETIYTQSGTVPNDSDTDFAVPDQVDDSNPDSTNRAPDVISAPNATHGPRANENPSVEIISADADNAGNSVASGSAESGPTAVVKGDATDRTDDASDVADNANRNRDDAGKKIKWDCGRHFSDQTDQQTGETVGTSASTDKNSAVDKDASKNEPPRDKCTYGSQCYRRNSDHRTRFSHPGDADYDVPDDRPECPYGVRCYRKNPQHKRDFKHTKNRRSRAQTPVRARASDDASGTEQSSAEESIDESDYEPSLYDATSDDYLSEFDDKSDFDGISDCEDKQ